jgi:hypothetical protein
MSVNDDNSRRLADEEFESYNFGDDVTVESSSGWSSVGGTYTRPVFVYFEDDEPFADTKRLDFKVVFAPDGTVAEAYATSQNGERIGSRPQLVHARVTVDVVYDPAGESEKDLQRTLEFIGPHLTGNGLLSGDGPATVASHIFKVAVLSPEAAALTEGGVEQWIKGLIESGNMDLERLPLLMARYALTDPAQMREELAERMGLFEQDDDDASEQPRERN